MGTVIWNELGVKTELRKPCQMWTVYYQPIG
jgi:hypothetical protein